MRATYYCYLLYDDISLQCNAMSRRTLYACVIFIFDLPRDFSIPPYLNLLGWLRVKTWGKYFIATNLYSILTTGISSYLWEMFLHVDDVRVRNRMRDRKFLNNNPSRTSLYNNSFSTSSNLFWNSLHENIRNTENSTTFKTDAPTTYLL